MHCLGVQNLGLILVQVKRISVIFWFGFLLPCLLDFQWTEETAASFTEVCTEVLIHRSMLTINIHIRHTLINWSRFLSGLKQYSYEYVFDLGSFEVFQAERIVDGERFHFVLLKIDLSWTPQHLQMFYSSRNSQKVNVLYLHPERHLLEILLIISCNIRRALRACSLLDLSCECIIPGETSF